MSTSKYHEMILEAVGSSGVCSPQQLDELRVFLRGLAGECTVDGPQIWRHISSKILLPSHDFAVHLRLAAAVYDNWSAAALGRPPLWLPCPEETSRTNIARFLSSIEKESWWQEALTRHTTNRPHSSESQKPSIASGADVTPAAAAPNHQPSYSHNDLVRRWRVLQVVSWECPEDFYPAVWRELGLTFEQQPARMLHRHPTDPDQCRWLPGARLNIAACALAAPRAPPAAPALLWAPDGAPNVLQAVTRDELRASVRHLAACIRARFKPGDALALYLPLTPHAVALYLAVVLSGCVVVSVADSFSGAELATRLRLAGAVGVFTQDVVLRGGKALPLYEKVVQFGIDVVAVVLPASEVDAGSAPSSGPTAALRPGDMSWSAFRTLATPLMAASFTPHVADAYDVTNVLFSSGTTGEPKAIPWTHLTPLRCALDGWAQLDVRPGSVVAWPTSLGWMMGPWLLYAVMLNGATVALYGGAPLGRDFLQFVSAARVDVLGLVPSVVRAWRHGGGAGAGGPTGGVNLSCVRVFGSTGEASSAEDYHWLMSRARGYRPVVEYCGGTEIGGGYVSSTLLHPCAPSTFTTATLGCRMVLLAEGGEGDGEGQGGAVVWDGGPIANDKTAGSGGGGGGVTGEVALAMPMLGVSQRLLDKDHYKVYYSGMQLYGGLPLRRHGDELAALPAPGPGPAPRAFCALGRCDDTMNLGGIKVSSVELERAVVVGVPGVAEAAAVGVAPPRGGPEELHLYLVLAGGGGGAVGAALAATAGGGDKGSSLSTRHQEQRPVEAALLLRQCQEAVRSRLNPLFKVSRVVVVPSLPRNASNKVLRRVLREQSSSRARL